MLRRVLGPVPALAVVVVGSAWFMSGGTSVSGQGASMPSTAKGDWTHYTADVRGSRYSPLDQINAHELRQARSRVAIQDRQPRHAARVQARRHTAR